MINYCSIFLKVLKNQSRKQRGIVLTGGGCLLRGLEHYLTKETGVPVFRAENPLTCVVLGTGRYLAELKY